MERRGFLKGIFGGVTAAGLIVAAKPEEIAAFASPLVKDAPVLLDAAPLPRTAPGCGEHLYNARGELVAMVTRIDVTHDRVDVTTAFDSKVQYVRGLPNIHLEARCVGHVELRPGSHSQFPELRGKRR